MAKRDMFALFLVLVYLGYAWGVCRIYTDYASQDAYTGPGIVLESRDSDDDGVFRRVVVEMLEIDDVVIFDLSEQLYYQAGEPAVGGTCQIVRTPYFSLFFVSYSYDIQACAAQSPAME